MPLFILDNLISYLIGMRESEGKNERLKVESVNRIGTRKEAEIEKGREKGWI